MKTLIIGASSNPERYSYLALNRLRKFNHEVVAIGNRVAKVADVDIQKGLPALTAIDTVTLYLNPTNQIPYYDYLLQLKPRRVIFNPGTENIELEKKLQENNIETIEACTLVMLSTGQF